MPSENGYIVVSWTETAGEYHDQIKKETVWKSIINIEKIILIFSYVYNFKLKRLSCNERHYTSKNLIIYGNKDTRNKNIIKNREENGQFILNSYKPLTNRRFKKTDVSQKDQR